VVWGDSRRRSTLPAARPMICPQSQPSYLLEFATWVRMAAEGATQLLTGVERNALFWTASRTSLYWCLSTMSVTQAARPVIIRTWAGMITARLRGPPDHAARKLPAASSGVRSQYFLERSPLRMSEIYGFCRPAEISGIFSASIGTNSVGFSPVEEQCISHYTFELYLGARCIAAPYLGRARARL